MQRGLLIIGLVIALGIALTVLFVGGGVFESTSNGSRITLYDAIRIANDTASEHDLFDQQTTWHLKISRDGKIRVIDETGKTSGPDNFSCQFSLMPAAGVDYSSYVSVFRNDNAGFLVMVNDKTGEIQNAGPLPLDTASCGP